jgi:hypothetical protein
LKYQYEVLKQKYNDAIKLSGKHVTVRQTGNDHLRSSQQQSKFEVAVMGTNTQSKFEAAVMGQVNSGSSKLEEALFGGRSKFEAAIFGNGVGDGGGGGGESKENGEESKENEASNGVQLNNAHQVSIVSEALRSVETLAQVKEMFDRFAVDGLITAAELMQAMTELGTSMSRSSLATYLKSRRMYTPARRINFYE